MNKFYGVCLIILVECAHVAKAEFLGQQRLDISDPDFSRIKQLEVPDGPLSTPPQMMPGKHPPTVVQAAPKEYETPEGGFDPHAPIGSAIKWSKTSKFSTPVQWFFAVLWIVMLASMPMIIPMISHQQVTKTQMIVGASMMVVLFGGFFLFTNIILFQSAHFDEIRPLTMVECIYFMSQLITTVGYGDIGPAKPRGQMFVTLYVLGALFVIAMVISELVEYLTKIGAEYKHHLHKSLVSNYEAPRKPDSIHDLLHKDKPSLTPLLLAVAGFVACASAWVLFFSMHPDEGKSVLQATYMSIITLSTVGLGYFTPVTEEGMIFAAFFMLFGTTALVAVVGRFTDYTVQLHEWENCHGGSKSQSVRDLKEMVSGSDKCNELQFMKFALMQNGTVSEEEFEDIARAFQNLIPKSGEVKVGDIEANIMSYGARTPR